MDQIHILSGTLSKHISHIIHCSDLHIRTGDFDKSRYNDYLYCFEQLFNNLKQLDAVKDNSAIAVFCGDFFQFKNKLDSLSVKIFNMFIQIFTDHKIPLYIIQGNHDFLQNNSQIPDVVSSLLHNNYNPFVHYLDNTGLYQVDNIGFGMVRINDVLQLGNGSGYVENLPKFPSPYKFPQSVQTKIALFHGSFKEAHLFNCKSISNLSIDWIKNAHYDIGLFGDIHKCQIYPNNTYSWDSNTFLWGYSGSLIQQDFGEDTLHHGYLLWDIRKKIVSQISVQSVTTFVNMSLDNDNIICQVSKDKQYPIDIFIKKCMKHTNSHNWLIKFKGDIPINISDNLTNVLKNHNITSSLIKGLHTIIPNCVDNSQSHMIITDVAQYNSQTKWIEYISTIDNQQILEKGWKNWILNPNQIDLKSIIGYYPPILDDLIKKRSNEISKHINLFNSAITNTIQNKKLSFKLIKIEWDYILCYGKDNLFDFNNMRQKLCVINGNNNSGKTSFFETIVLGLYGQEIPSRHNASRSGCVICYRKPKDQKSQIKLTFSIGSNTYHLYRLFNYHTESKETTRLHTKKIYLSSYDNNIIASSVKSVNDWVNNNIGSMENFLLSCMITQSSDANFFNLKSAEQVSFLDEVLHINHVDLMSNIIKQIQLAIVAIQEKTTNLHLQLSNDIKNLSDPTNNIKQLAENSIELQQQHSQIHKQIQDMQINWISSDLFDLNKSSTEIEKNISFFSNQIKLISVDISEQNDLTKQKNIYENELKNLTKPSQSIKSNLNDCLKQLEKLKNLKPIKPLLPQNNYQNKLQEIEKWKTIHSSVINLSLDERNKLSTDTNNRLMSLRESLNRLTFEKPNKPNITLEQYITFEKKLQSITLQIQSLSVPFNSIQYINDFCQNHPLIKPKDDLNEHILKEQLKSEFNKLYDESWKCCSDQILINLLNANNEKNKKLTLNINNKQHEIDLIDQQIENFSNQLDTINDKISCLTMHSKPYISLEEVSQLIKQYEESSCIKQTNTTTIESLNQQIQSFYEHERLNNELDTINHEINQINQQAFPFNPNCSACQKQPWKLRLNQLVQSKEQLTQKLPQIDNNFNLIQKKDQLADLNKWITHFEFLSQRINEYKQIKKDWEQYQIAINQLNILNQQKSHISEQQKQSKKLKTSKKSSLYKLEHNKKQNDVLVQHIQYAVSNRPRWIFMQQQINEINNYNQMKFVYHIYQLYLDLHVNETKQQKLLLDQMQQWNKNYTEINSQISMCERNIKLYSQQIDDLEHYAMLNQEYQETMNHVNNWNKYNQYKIDINNIDYTIHQYRIEEIDKKLKQIQLKLDNSQKLNYWTHIKNCQPIFQERLRLISQNDIISNSIHEKNIELEKYQFIKQQRCEKLLEIDSYKKLIDYMQKLDQQTLFILSTLTQFRTWLYNSILIPKIIAHTNQLVQHITNCSDYILDAQITSDHFNKIVINWSIKSPSGVSTLLKAGGFRQYMFGLIIRIVLTSMEASHLNNSQFFIDEGFTSCDAENLDKIPMFLSNLTELYRDGVCAVSHLQLIKDCADLTVVIEKNKDATTRLYWKQYETQLESDSSINKLKLVKKSKIQQYESSSKIIKPLKLTLKSKI